VDDSFVIIKNDFVSAFLESTLNSIDPKISFAIETEENGQIAFLDTRQQEQRCHLLTCIENQHTPMDIWIAIHITRENTTHSIHLLKTCIQPSEDNRWNFLRNQTCHGRFKSQWLPFMGHL